MATRRSIVVGTPQYEQYWQEKTSQMEKQQTSYQKAYEEAYAKANEANESRYQDILGQYQGRYDRGMGYVDSLSQQQEMDAREAGGMRMSNMNQELVSRGLTGTTIKPTQEALVNRETDANVRRIQDAKMRERLAADSQLSGDKLGFMERREDMQPDLSRMASLMEGYGQYGSGGGGYSVRKVGGTRSSSYGGSSYNPGSSLGGTNVLGSGLGSTRSLYSLGNEAQLSRRSGNQVGSLTPTRPGGQVWVGDQMAQQQALWQQQAARGDSVPPYASYGTNYWAAL